MHEVDDMDTREKLEADLIAMVTSWKDYDGNYMRVYGSVAYAQVKELLDRQADITEQESRNYQAERIDELLKQRDEALRAMGAAQDAMELARDERDELRDSLAYLKDVERENDKLRNELNTLDLAYETLRAESTRTDDGWMRLPVDADGEVVHIGDTITDGVLRKAEVIGVNERDVFFHDDGHVKRNRAKSWRRYVEPEPRTIEDVLADFAYRVCDMGNVADSEFERYAAELRQMMNY